MGEIEKEMEELERDLVTRDVSIETMKRQQELMVRLLEAENAEMTRGEDNKRKSKVGQQDIATNPPALEKYLKQKNQEVEWLRTIPIELDPYYRDRVNDYFNNLDLKNSDY
jgi:ribosomal protein L11 methylase PrmA